MTPHADDPTTLARALGTDPERGLDATEARRRLAADGPNAIARHGPPSAPALFARQFAGVVVWLLIVAAGVSIALGEMLDGGAILAFVVLNAVIGFVQEYRAERAVAALARLAAPQARVVRDGVPVVVPAEDVVRGDVLLVADGDLVAADARLLDAAGLRVNEASLTGESEPVDKAPGTLRPETPLADRRNMLFLGTAVARGSAHALVVATGMRTELGRIATLLARASRDTTPLQQELDRVGRRLLAACLAIVAVVFLLGLGRGQPLLDLFTSAVSLAVAAVPEGLAAIVTVALALGVQRMARRNALVRRLTAVETLGAAEVVCTDKTGTLTVGEMTVRAVVTSAGTFRVTGEGYEPRGEILTEAGRPAGDDPLLAEVVLAGAACNDARLALRDGRAAIVGDPTEGALLVLAAKAGLDPAALDAAMPRLATEPFSSETKRMAVVRDRNGARCAFVKGAPEVIVPDATAWRTARGDEPMDDAARTAMLDAAATLAGQALRVLAIAEVPPDRRGADGLVFLGLVGMQDPPRPEARDAVARCRRAGIRTVMITGDHAATAAAVARELDILRPGDRVLEGRTLERTTDAELRAVVRETSVYARVTAEHKLRIVRTWKALGAVVAMTGDGVNDAPALREAAIGVAMGRTGTEVTKEAADLVVTDDDFSSIVAAVEEGRGIYDNIRKTLGYLLAGNAAELAVMLVAGLVGWPMPLVPIQLLWINLVTDGLPALALATDPVDPDVLSRPPRPPDARMLSARFLRRTAATGALAASVTLAVYWWVLARDGAEAARSAAFAMLVTEELVRSFGARSVRRTVWEVGLFSNVRLFAVVAVTFGLQLVIHNTGGGAVFHARPFPLAEGAAIAALACVPLAVLEATKVVRRRRRGALVTGDGAVAERRLGSPPSGGPA